MVGAPADWAWSLVSMGALFLSMMLLGMTWVVWRLLGSGRKAAVPVRSMAEQSQRKGDRRRQ